ncbi:MAG: class I SAM-dependent methyltransferase [Fuerstiella sp.]
MAGFEARRKWRDQHPDRFATKITHRSGSLQKAFAAFTNIDEGAILDIGCGPGNFRNFFSDRPVKYWGVDPLPLPESAHFRFARAVAEYLPFRDGMFTDVVVMAAMDHFQDVAAFCDETVRVLTPGGRLHIVQSVHDVHGPVTAVKAAAHWVKDRMESEATMTANKTAPKHMTEFDGDFLRHAMDLRFEITEESKYSKRWYSPDNMFVTMEPRSR